LRPTKKEARMVAGKGTTVNKVEKFSTGKKKKGEKKIKIPRSGEKREALNGKGGNEGGDDVRI